ncbi:hypothetical protein BDV30DRAFT_87421 [Aspergillus minisclerotigenes]|uniref:Uncharacterized protein n=1 Tax=Aspergillus minisclerotigenes TaxID=656917 RepID=A0A5N6J7D2_9EURO|nr:hypothetical protein BDV30DRAFT_87421 [Aspergillus minisclerotigenes]
MFELNLMMLVVVVEVQSDFPHWVVESKSLRPTEETNVLRPQVQIGRSPLKPLITTTPHHLLLPTFHQLCRPLFPTFHPDSATIVNYILKLPEKIF